MAACIAGMFGVSLFQIPKTVRETVEKTTASEAAKAYQQVMDEAKTNAISAAESAKQSLQNATRAENGVKEMKDKWDTELKTANATISELKTQLRTFERQHDTQVEKLETDNKILMAQTVIKFYEQLITLVPGTDSNLPKMRRQLEDAKKQLSDLQSKSSSLSRAGR